MSIWSKIFGGDSSSQSSSEVQSKQLPSTMVSKEFGEVNVRINSGKCEVLATILMEPQGKEAEGWQTGVAIDASASMRGLFGKGIISTGKSLTQDIIQTMIKRGSLQIVNHNGQQLTVPTDRGEEELVQMGYHRWSKNDIEPQARRFTAYLASHLDADGGTSVIYWACGDGSQIDEIGDYTSDQCELAKFDGPKKHTFGNRTILTPAVRYFADRFKDAKNGMYVFITDGELHDLDEVKKYTISLCKDIAAKRRNSIKCVLVGLGDAVNEDQMEQLDDLDSGTDIDIWDHKICKDMRSITEIFAEVVSENTIVAPTARILDAAGNVVKNFTDGLPAKIAFTMPANSPHFVLDVGGQHITQRVR